MPEDGEREADFQLSLEKVHSAATTLKILEDLCFSDKEFIILNGLTSRLCRSLCNLLDRSYPKIRKDLSLTEGILTLKIPTTVHEVFYSWLIDCKGDWLASGLTIPIEDLDLQFMGSPRISLPNPVPRDGAPPVQWITKEPDGCIFTKWIPSVGPDPKGNHIRLPNIIIETGWSQTYASLIEKASDFLIGGAPTLSLSPWC
ncbi:hypothetical protein N7495_007985 [Penicillium taxi]|uniref:uncharacterized protein n=1 Tax=Penicillium taxi TaxID=168475 RepID=UPI002545A461|nr:uncharacterized protein N7495_007985 [Penicillium taxi]KAJ5887944.1 hypothetical protein N7495_007985 [Penicillium taxi]